MVAVEVLLAQTETAPMVVMPLVHQQAAVVAAPMAEAPEQMPLRSAWVVLAVMVAEAQVAALRAVGPLAVLQQLTLVAAVVAAALVLPAVQALKKIFGKIGVVIFMAPEVETEAQVTVVVFQRVQGTAPVTTTEQVTA
jgi:hypothetical protein